MTLYSSRLPWRTARVARELQDAIVEDRGVEGLAPPNFRLLARYGVPGWAKGVTVVRRGLRWTVEPTTTERPR
jgi:hypothetical protein